VTGTVGVGRSVTADMIGSLLQARLVPHAVIDLDEIRRHWPSPPDDPFDFELELRNLQPVAMNYLAGGIRLGHIVITSHSFQLGGTALSRRRGPPDSARERSIAEVVGPRVRHEVVNVVR
jgi:hypothetical protein